MAKTYQSIDPAILALQTAKNTMPASPSTQVVAKPSLNVKKQQTQAISTNITPPVTKIGGISSPFWATNINSSVMWWATPQEIGTRAKELQSLPKAMPQTGTNEDIRSRLSTMGGDIVLRWKGLAEIKSAYPEFAHIDDETFKKIGGDIALRGKGIDDILRDYPELQQKINTQEKTTVQKIATPFVRFARGVADVGAWIQEGIDTWLSKLWILPDQTAINKKARVRDEEMTQQILWKKSWYEKYVQEWWRIAWSFIANAPANKFWTAGKMALWAAEWLLWWATYNLSTGEWVWSPVNLWISTAIGAAVPAVWPLYQSIKWSLPWVAKWVKNIIPWLQKAAWQKAEWLAVQWLLNANDAKKIVRTLKETWEGDVWSLWRRALERWIAWKTTEQAIDTAKEIASKNYQWVRNAISEISDKVWTLAKDDAVAKAMTMVWKQADNINNRVWFNAVDITEIDELWRKALNWELTLLDKQRSKELIDEFVNIFKKSWEVSDTQIADVAATLRNKIKNSIEDIVDYTTQWKVNIREMNREVAVAKAFEQWIQNKATANELKQFAIQWIAWWVASNQWDFTTPEWIGKFFLWAFMWRQVGKLLWDPAVLWKIAKVVDKLSAWSRKWLLEFIKKPTQEIPEALLKEIVPLRNEIKDLALPFLKNVDTPNLPMASATNNKALLKWTNIANTPKPTPKTPPITVEKWAIGMWTPKVNKAPVIPTKATVAPSVSAPKVDTFARMTELDSNPLYKKKSFQETNYWRNAKWLETEFWTIQKVNVDNRYNPQSYTIDGVQYPTSQIKNFREKQAPEVVAQANKVSKAISDLKAIESWKGKIMWSSLRSVLDDLWIKDVNSIPEWTEQDILQMVRARNPVPSKWMPKLWKETLEQNRYHWWTKKIDSFDISKAKEWNYWKWIYLTDNPKLAEYYWGLKIDNEALNNLPKGSLNFPERQKWIVSEFSIPKNIKIKELKTPPSKKEIEAIKNQWYDWVKFPDTLEKQDWNYRLLWDYQDWNTVFVFNTDKFNKKPLPPLPKKWK